MDARYTNAFVRSISNTFETVCCLPVTLRTPTLKTGREPTVDVSGIIGFSGDAVGSVALGFSFDTASKIASRFAGTARTPDQDEFVEAIEDLARIVAGGTQSHLDGLDVFLSLPHVIVGANHAMAASKASPRIVLRYDTEIGPFFVEVAMKLAACRLGPARAAAGV